MATAVERVALSAWGRVWRVLGRRPIRVWHSDAYRLPFSSPPTTNPIDPRRADLARWYLERLNLARIKVPHAISYAKLARVHGEKYLESLQEAKTLAMVFGVDVSEIPTPEVLLRSVRIVVGGTVGAALDALSTGEATLNLQGGFHHAGLDHGGGLSALNDIAVAVAELRSRGFTGKVGVVDVDAHPPDGTAQCLAKDSNAWIGSLSGSDWGPLSGVDETVLPPQSGDKEYLSALRALLNRAPKFGFAFVVAGGDVLGGDSFGLLALTESGVRQRDKVIHDFLRGIPSVWLPGGGYQARAWRVLAGTGLVLSGRPSHRISHNEDPMHFHFGEVARELADVKLSESDSPTFPDELDELMSHRAPQRPKQHLLQRHEPNRHRRQQPQMAPMRLLPKQLLPKRLLWGIGELAPQYSR